MYKLLMFVIILFAFNIRADDDEFLPISLDNVSELQQIYAIEFDHEFVGASRIAFSQNGDHFVFWDRGVFAAVWHANNPEEHKILDFTDSERDIPSVAGITGPLNSSGTQLITELDGAIQILDITTQQVVWEFKFETSRDSYDVQFSPDDKYIAIFSRNEHGGGLLDIVEIASKEIVYHDALGAGFPAFSRSWQMMAYPNTRNEVMLWEISFPDDPALLETIPSRPDLWIGVSLQFLHNEDYLFFAQTDNDLIMTHTTVWDTNNMLLYQQEEFKGYLSLMNEGALLFAIRSPRDPITGESDYQLWHVAEKRNFAQLSVNPGLLVRSDFAGTMFTTLSGPDVIIHNAETGELLTILEGPNVSGHMFSPDMRFLVSWDETVQIWGVER